MEVSNHFPPQGYISLRHPKFVKMFKKVTWYFFTFVSNTENIIQIPNSPTIYIYEYILKVTYVNNAQNGTQFSPHR